jgi:hypothetical protein
MAKVHPFLNLPNPVDNIFSNTFSTMDSLMNWRQVENGNKILPG